MRIRKLTVASILVCVGVAFMTTTSCGGGAEKPAEAEEPAVQIKRKTPKANPNGVGPISELELGEYDEALALEGEAIFDQMCVACHKMDKKHVGPALGEVLDRRNPAWVMNMILNPEGMVKDDPVARELFAEYLSPMANQNLTEDQARAVLEYFRKYNQD